MMKKTLAGWAASAAIVAALGATPQVAVAAVQLTGCTGGTFGSSCGLDELVSGGSMVVGGYRFSNFALSLNNGRLLNAASIRVDAIESAGGLGFAFVDVGQTLRAVNGDLTSSNLNFDITAVAGSPLVVGSALRVDVGDITAAGSYGNVFADLFNPSFTTFLGNMTAYCDGPSCTNSTLSSPAAFAGSGAMSVVAGIDVAAGLGGLAQVNSISMVLTPVPEPAALSLFAAGLGTLAWLRGMRRKEAA